jgi:hypothetical protein
MMLIVKNTNEQDLHLARINVVYDDMTAVFQVTDLPAGASAVVLEQNKRPYSGKKYQDIKVQNVLLFDEPMSLREDIFSISGENGSIEIKNISKTPVTGDIYVYYKNSSSKLFYGGITYRVKISDGLDAGESKRVTAGHYSPNSSTLMMVSLGE